METFTRNGLTFDVTDAGPADGEVVVLLHGFPQDRSAWQDITPALNAAGLRTLAPDQRGYSPQASPRERSAYVPPELVADVLALADAAGAERFHVVGHDWGGAIAWALAATQSRRIATATVLSTPVAAAMAWSFLHSDQLRRSWYMGLFQLPRLPERRVHADLRRLFTRTGMSAEQAERYVTRFPTPESLTGPLNWYRGMARSLLQRPNGTPITVPSTYIWGNRDFALGRAAAEKTAEFVSADYRFVELDAGHWLPEVNADDVTRHILARIDIDPSP